MKVKKQKFPNDKQLNLVSKNDLKEPFEPDIIGRRATLDWKAIYDDKLET